MQHYGSLAFFATMTQKVKLENEEKALADCTPADIEAKAQGSMPATASGNNIGTKALYATLAQKMRKAGAETVADLGVDEVKAWEQHLGLHYGSTADAIKRLLKKRS